MRCFFGDPVWGGVFGRVNVGVDFLSFFFGGIVFDGLND